MKYFFLFLLLISGVCYGQTTYYIQADSVRFRKVGANSDFILENSTRTRTGAYLKNRWNGRTEFGYAVDSGSVSGSDLILWRGNGTQNISISGLGGGSVDAGRGIAETGTVISLADYYRSQYAPSEQSAYIPSLQWEARDATTRNFWQDGTASFSINDTIFNIGGYTLDGIGRINDTIAYSVDNALNFSVHSLMFPYSIANMATIKARFPGDWNYILGNGFGATQMDGVIRFKTIYDFDTMTLTAEYGNIFIFGACRDEDGNLYVLGGQTAADSSTTTGKVWRSTSGGATWTEIQSGVSHLRGNLSNAVVYRDGWVYVINAAQRYDAIEGNKTYTSQVWKIAIIDILDANKWKRIADAPSAVGSTQFITTEVYNGHIWVSSGSNGGNTNGIAYLDKNDVWHTYNNYTGITSGTALESQHASSFVVHRNSLYRIMGSGTNVTYVLKDSTYLADHFVMSYLGAGQRAYFGTTKSAQETLIGNGVAPGSTNSTFKRVTTDTEQPYYLQSSTGLHSWGYLNSGNSTTDVDVATTTGRRMWLDVSSGFGILKLSSNPALNLGGLLQVDGGAAINGTTRILSGDLSIIESGKFYTDGDAGGNYLETPSGNVIDVYTNGVRGFIFNTSGILIPGGIMPTTGSGGTDSAIFRNSSSGQFYIAPGGAGGGSGTVDPGAANKIAYYPGAGTTVNDLTDLEYVADGTNDHLKFFSLTKMVHLGARTSGTSYPGLWFGNITPSFTNYSLLYDVASGLIIGAPASQALQYRINNVNYFWLSASGGISLGANNYNTDPGVSNLIVEGEVGIGINANPSARLHIAAGTTVANTAPQQFTSGPLETVIRGGIKEYNNAHYESNSALNRYPSGGAIKDFYADENNSGTGETDAFSYTTKANTLVADGEKITFTYTINLSDVTATAQIKVWFAANTIGNTGALTVSATGAVIVSGWIIRTSSTTVRTSVNISSPGASTAIYTSENDLTGLTLSGTNVLKLTLQSGGAGGGSNDLTAKMGVVNWFGAANN